MITEIIQQQDGQYAFVVGKCKYKSPDFDSLTEVRLELLQQMAQPKVR